MTSSEKMIITRRWCHGIMENKTPDGYYSILVRTIYDVGSTRRTVYNTNRDEVVENAYQIVKESIWKYLYVDFTI